MRNRATMCLSTLTKDYAVRLQCKGDINDTLLPDLLPMLAPPTSPVGQENAASIIANLSTEFSVRKQLLAQDVVTPLVALLSSSQPDIIRNALQALLMLCEDYEGRAQMMAAEPAQPLLALLDSDFRAIQELALNVVAKVSRNQTCRQTLYEAGVLERIIGFVTNPEYSKSYVVALDALSTMLYEPPALERVGAIPDNGSQADAPLVKVLQLLTHEDVEVKVRAMECVRTAAHDNDNRRILRDFKTEAAVAGQLLPDDPKQPINAAVSCAACNALSALAIAKSSAAAVLTAGSLPKLVRLLTCEHESCVQAAAQTLAVLVSKSTPNRLQVFEAGVYPGLLEILKATAVQRLPTQAHAASCVASFAQEPQLRASMATVSPIAPLVQLLNRGAHTAALQEKCLDALTALAGDAAYRRELSTCDPYPRIVENISSADQHVGLAAARIVHQLCEDPASAAELIHEGALGALQRVAASRSHTSDTIQAAMHALLCNHLSAKFALTNELSASDKVKQIFFDPGTFHRIPSLKHLHTHHPFVII
ncbi:hypothetical protein PTSG_09450 [Salpingoeca rosetta]|uniref:Uncharacterized protein n=1 Tax=Salpingoeca rosetta (strain ATCC 50818 / BSB-021) TaxID=946362 RepID=F2UMN3_SALR5|nr:uncharacterized protein PTSG_09450 [Salpingoeca rosetta]EGD78382.1 hypothetical protein PTSG_09450 [Salpingoeca rosetta]|eukprot:XP_004989705.1 hypothetical protein PTSG_09450 [Salpingoeca rosetta]